MHTQTLVYVKCIQADSHDTLQKKVSHIIAAVVKPIYRISIKATYLWLQTLEFAGRTQMQTYC